MQKQKQNRFGLVQVLFLIAALVAANVYVARSAENLEAQGETIPPTHTKCTFPMPLPGNYCDYYPTSDCDVATCAETALEP